PTNTTTRSKPLREFHVRHFLNTELRSNLVEVLNDTTVNHSGNHELNRLLRYIPDLVPGLTNSVLTLLESIRHTLSDRILQGVEHLVTNKHPHPVNVVLNVAPSSLNNRLQELELRGKMSVDPFNNGLENVLLDKRPRDVNVVPDLRPNQFNNSLEELEPRYQLVVHKVHNRSENVLLNELPRRVNRNADTLPNHLNDGPEQLEHWRKIILHKRNDSVEDDLNALPPSRDNQLNPVKHRDCDVFPQPPEHGTNSREHGLNDRQHIRLEPCNNSLNRKHDPIPSNLNAASQPFSASNNTVPNRLHDRPQHVTEPIAHSRNRDLNASPRRVNTVTEPAHLLVHENKPSNKQGDGSNNQTNRVSLHRRVKNTHLHRSTRSGKLLSHQQTIPNSLTNSNRLQRQTVSRNATNNSGKDRPPFLEQANNRRKNRRKLLDALNDCVANRLHHRGQLLQQRHQRLTDSDLNVILGYLERLTEGLSDFLASLRLRRGKFARPVLHHRQNIINTDFALRGHLLDNVTSRAELRRQSINDRITRLRNHRQRVIHDDTAIVDTLKKAVHGAVKFCGTTTGTNNRPTNLIKNLYSVVTLNPGVRKRLRGLTIR